VDSGGKVATLIQLPFTTLGCARLVRGVSAVFSMGGYVAGPAVMAALLRGVPVVVMEPNAVPGFTNRDDRAFVVASAGLVPQTASYFPKGVRKLPVASPREFFRIVPKARGGTLDLLITGGSQGSRTLNRAGKESWPSFAKPGWR